MKEVGIDKSFFNISIRENMLLFTDDFENIVHLCQEFDIYGDIMNLENYIGQVIKVKIVEITKQC